jgi:hypothetical protein
MNELKHEFSNLPGQETGYILYYGQGFLDDFNFVAGHPGAFGAGPMKIDPETEMKNIMELETQLYLTSKLGKISLTKVEAQDLIAVLSGKKDGLDIWISTLESMLKI